MKRYIKSSTPSSYLKEKWKENSVWPKPGVKNAKASSANLDLAKRG